MSYLSVLPVFFDAKAYAYRHDRAAHDRAGWQRRVQLGGESLLVDLPCGQRTIQRALAAAGLWHSDS
jgi:hypothetical protein